MSKFVAEDVGLFISLIADMFPGLNPEKASFKEVEEAIQAAMEEDGLVHAASWVGKVVQLYESYLVRHGIMVVGPAGCGKSKILNTLKDALSAVLNRHSIVRMNPKAITPKQMYGFQDPVANEWTEGIFTALWKKSNDPRKKGINPWMVMDGPVDSIWIEDLNTVLDDNRMLTCANGDRIPMLAAMKIMFEPENLNNASPATVSRAGIIYVSGQDLGWEPIAEAWCQARPDKAERVALQSLFDKYMSGCLAFVREPQGPGVVITCEPMCLVTSCMALLKAILPDLTPREALLMPLDALERIFCFCLLWACGGTFESETRAAFEGYLRLTSDEFLPPFGELTAYEYFCDIEDSCTWKPWKVDNFSPGLFADFTTMLVPTMDSARVEYMIGLSLHVDRPALLVGGPGTAKSCIVNRYIEQQDPLSLVYKGMNFSSATTPGVFQSIVESCVDKRSGKIYGPPPNKKLILFMDDLGMPAINKWGDQITLEIIRQLLEMGYMWNLEKNKAGDMKHVEDLKYVMAMNQPGGGKNDIPQRAKRHCLILNVPMPSLASINQIFGTLLEMRFDAAYFDKDVLHASKSLVSITMSMYERTKVKMLPTPAKFHYIFNLRDVSRVFQGMLHVPKDVMKKPTNTSLSPSLFLLATWRHECLRVFQDKLITDQDKEWVSESLLKLLTETFLEADALKASEPLYLVDFLRDVPEDPDTGEPTGPAPKIYEAVASLEAMRLKAEIYLCALNDSLKVGKFHPVLS